MAFPQTSAPTETAFSGNTTAHVCNLPGSLNNGDLLMVHFSAGTVSGSVDFGTTPSGWTKLWSLAQSFLIVTGSFIKISDGTETTVDIVTDVNTSAGAQAYRITKVSWFGDLLGVEAGTAVQNGSQTTTDPPSLTASWGALDNLWFAVAGGTNDDAGADSFPSGFTGGVNTISGGGTDDGANAASARKEDASATVDPGVFTWDQTETAICNTIAIRPSSGIQILRRRREFVGAY